MIIEITYNSPQYIAEVSYEGSSVFSEMSFTTNTYFVEVLQGGGGGDVSLSWDSITGKPSTFTPSAHSHQISDVTNLQTSLDGKASASHSHSISDVTGLQSALDGKQASGSYATTSQVNAKQDLITGTDGQIVIKSGSTAGVVTTGTLAYPDATWDNVTGKPSTFAPAPHSHPISDVTGLQAAIDGKQATLVSGTNIKTVNGTSLLGSGNITIEGGSGATSWGAITGTLSSQTDLQTALNGKQNAGSYANASHTHAIADVTGLQTALDGKQASGSYANATHTHAISDTTGLQTALDGKAATSHSHSISDVTGLQTALDGKQASGSYAAASHTHAISDITSLQTSLDGKQANITGTDGQIVIKSGSTAGVITTGTLAYPDADWANITNKPSTFTPSTHSHVIADITGLQTALDGKADAPSRSQMLVVETDFFATTSPFAQGLIGAAISSGTITQIAAEPSHPGIVELRDSTTANGGYRIMTDVLAFRLEGGEKFVCSFQIRGVRSTAVCRLGFQDSTSATAPTDGVYLDFVGNGTSITTTGRTRNNNAASATASTHSTATNTWYTCVIELNSDATLVTFSIFTAAGVLDWSDTLSTNIPTASGRETGAGVYVGESTTDAAAGIIRLDYLRIESSKTLVR